MKIYSFSDIEDYINKKYKELAISSLKKELLPEVHLLIQKGGNGKISLLKNENDHLLTEFSLCEEVKEKNIVIKKLIDNCQQNCRQNINRDISNNQNSFKTNDKFCCSK